MELLTKIFISIIAPVICAESARSGAFVQIDGTDVTLGNELFNVTFWANATAKSLFKNDVNLVTNIEKGLQTWYLDWNGERAYFAPSTVSVISNTDEEAHVAFVQTSSPGLLYIELHLVVFPKLSGLYQYIKASNPTQEEITLAEFRTVHRFDHTLMPKISNIVRNGTTPDLTDRPTIQDSTWQLPDGTYWSKYDFCGYIRETPWFGVYGGGFGAWILSASREYHSGGPLKQDLLVHQNSLMINYLHSTHFGTPSLVAFPGWSKFYGPYLIYINNGTEEEVSEGVAKQAVIEQQQWPYKWVNDTEYPLSRGSVTGKVTGQTKAMVVVYDSTQEEFDGQSLGYLFYNETDKDGSFTINNIRPGNYHVVAYPLAGQGSDNLARKNVSIIAEENQDVGALDLPEPSNILWAIGETNRRSDGYHYSDELRNFYWHVLPPKNLTFRIGKSDARRDWYYAQSAEGIWKVTYEDHPDNEPRTLRVALAAASGSLIFNTTTARLRVTVNGVDLASLEYHNDGAVYRESLHGGNFHSEVILVPENLVADGKNTVSLAVLEGGVMYDTISLAVGSDDKYRTYN